MEQFSPTRSVICVLWHYSIGLKWKIYSSLTQVLSHPQLIVLVHQLKCTAKLYM